MGSAEFQSGSSTRQVMDIYFVWAKPYQKRGGPKKRVMDIGGPGPRPLAAEKVVDFAMGF